MKLEDQFTMGHCILNDVDVLLTEGGVAQDSTARLKLKVAKSIFMEAEKRLSDALEWECKQGDKLCEAAGVQRTEGGSLNPGKIIANLRAAPPSSEAVAVAEQCAVIVESQKLTEPARFGGNKWGAAGAMQIVCAAAIRAYAATLPQPEEKPK